MSAEQTLKKLEALLPDHLYAGSKDYRQSDLAGRVEWLITMYEGVKAERDELVDQLADIGSGEPD